MSQTFLRKEQWPRSLVAIDQLQRAHFEELFANTDSALHSLSRNIRRPSLRYHTIALLFLEPSTRTRLSFWSAVAQLEGKVLYNGNGSLSKGESLADTLRVTAGYADLVVLRHPGEDTAELSQLPGMPPIISAGDGANEHPSQALIDLYTIRRRCGRLDDLRVGVGFDPKHSRSIHSFLYALSRFKRNEVVVVAPKECQLTDEHKDELSRAGLTVTQSSNVNALFGCEIVYVNRFQRERWANPAAVDQHAEQFRLDAMNIEGSAVKHILNPLPRVEEIDTKLDDTPHAAYFEQARYGLPIRMALLETLVPAPRSYWSELEGLDPVSR